MNARKCFMCRLLAKLYETAKRRGEKCCICGFIAFLLSMPIDACAADKETAKCVDPAIRQDVPAQVVVKLPSTPLCWFVQKVTGKSPPTPRAAAIAFMNKAADSSGHNVRFE